MDTRLVEEFPALAAAMASAGPKQQLAAFVAAATAAVAEAGLDHELIREGLSALARSAPLIELQPRLHMLAETADEKCFDLEDEGRLEESNEFFSLARVAMGIEFALSGTGDELQAGLYEVLKSVEDPKVIVLAAESALG